MVVGDFATALDTVVVGSGPGGYVAAIRAAQLGQKVTVIEREKIGGTCLNVGCIPSKALIEAGRDYANAKNQKHVGLTFKEVALDFGEIQRWKNESVVNKLTGGIKSLFKKHQIEVLAGSAYFMDDHRVRLMTETAGATYSFNNLIIATGSQAIEIPTLPFGPRILDSTGLLELAEVPKKLVVVGGGYIGCELAGMMANFGTEVTILEAAPSILPNFEREMSNLVLANFKKHKVTVKTGVTVTAAKVAGEQVEVSYQGKEELVTLAADYVLVAVGRKPNTDDLGLEQTNVVLDQQGLVEVDDQGQTTVKGIYAIGDVTAGVALAHKASYEGKVVAGVIAGQKIGMDYQGMPEICFTEPELATVGLSKKAAQENGHQVKASKFPFAANGRALSLGEGNGFMQLISDEASGELLGAQIAGPEASNLISELTLALESHLTLEDLALTIHPHPSLSETVMDAAELGLGLPIHL